MSRNQLPPSSATDSTIITSLAFDHWASIGQRNLTAVMSEYSTRYIAVWWNVNGSKALETHNGKNDCNIPTGPGNCSAVVIAAWQSFFNATSFSSYLNYSICNFKVNFGEDQSSFVTATLWFYLSNETIKVPYDIDFSKITGQWQLERDSFGFPGTPAQVLQGSINPSCS
jgi:hypothetical protein